MTRRLKLEIGILIVVSVIGLVYTQTPPESAKGTADALMAEHLKTAYGAGGGGHGPLTDAIMLLANSILSVGGTLTAVFLRTKRTRKRYENGGSDRRKEVFQAGIPAVCALASGQLKESTDAFHAENREFWKRNLEALDRMAAASETLDTTMRALGDLALALAKKAGVETDLSPLNNKRRVT